MGELVRRIDETDPLVCPRRGATMRVIALITEPAVIWKILRHLAAQGIDGRGPPPALQTHRHFSDAG